MPRTLKPKKGTDMQKTLVHLPQDLYQQLRHYCVDANMTQSKAIEEALRRYLGTKGGETKKK
jgi:metal-responsive CopG/Arc/MetJ family transcriptional regulator